MASLACFLTSLVARPKGLGLLDVLRLLLFRAAREEHDKFLAVLIEVETVAGSECDPPFGDALSCRLHVSQVPVPNLAIAVVTLSAACVSSASNRSLNGPLPSSVS